MDIERPVINLALIMKKELDMAAAPINDREMVIPASMAPKEFKQGLAMLFGMRIIWHDDISEKK